MHRPTVRDSSHAWVTYLAAGHPLLEEMVVQIVPTEPGRIAEAVVSTCRDGLGVPHLHLLTVRCQGGVGQRTDGLELVRAGRLPTGVDPAEGADSVDVAVEVEGHEEARERFEALAEAVTGRPVIVDDNGDLVFDHVGHPVHVTFTENDASARIWAWVARGVRSRSDTALRLSELNLDEQGSWTAATSCSAPLCPSARSYPGTCSSISSTSCSLSPRHGETSPPASAPADLGRDRLL